MCISFSPTSNAAWTQHHFSQDLPKGYPLEVYPGYLAPLVVKSHQSQRIAIGLAAFGLIPAWSKDKKIAKHTYNARSETVAIKPSYRSAWHERRLGIVLVDHFYEPHYGSGRAQRWQIQQADQKPFGIACIWEQWQDSSQDKTTDAKIVSFSMLTINADQHPVMQQFHRPTEEKRTPLILHPTQFSQWLAADMQQIKEMLHWEAFPPLIAQERSEIHVG